MAKQLAMVLLKKRGEVDLFGHEDGTSLIAKQERLAKEEQPLK
jgi:hypothetical protein